MRGDYGTKFNIHVIKARVEQKQSDHVLLDQHVNYYEYSLSFVLPIAPLPLLVALLPLTQLRAHL